ncbi:unnamed protein product [Lasius platythorax]|uniref:Uncharacterized protein n=1 Tax=Lasius platythorax TaxID=488582 RepID=A0AAV2P7Y9_9HYME
METFVCEEEGREDSRIMVGCEDNGNLGDELNSEDTRKIGRGDNGESLFWMELGEGTSEGVRVFATESLALERKQGTN